MHFPSEEKSIIQSIQHPIPLEAGIMLDVMREDLIHPYISGNKWRKLKYNLLAASEAKQKIVTLGGAFSNHIYAVAAAGFLYNIQTIGIIRGERVSPLNKTLAFAESHGMQLDFISREVYRQRDTADFHKILRDQYGDFYFLPEGGTNLLAISGVAESLSSIPDNTYNFICCPCGTGGTVSGLVKGRKSGAKVIGFSVLKGNFMQEQVENLLTSANIPILSYKDDLQICENYSFGGYAKTNETLEAFMQDFTNQTSIPLEHVYSGKMFFGIMDMIQKNAFPQGTRILAIHTGGLRSTEPPFESGDSVFL